MSIQGIITAVKELDFEISRGHYSLVVTATDQCPIPALRLTSSTTVMTAYVRHAVCILSRITFDELILSSLPPQVLVTVVDVNDVTPTFPRPYEGPFEVTEGQPGPRVWTLRASDEDSGDNGKVEYSITDGDFQSLYH